MRAARVRVRVVHVLVLAVRVCLRVRAVGVRVRNLSVHVPTVRACTKVVRVRVRLRVVRVRAERVNRLCMYVCRLFLYGFCMCVHRLGECVWRL